jgi:replicative DNA helicase
MQILGRNAVPQLREGEIAVHTTWEDSIEDYGLSWISHSSRIPIASLYAGDMKEGEWEAVLKAAVERARQPLWAFGHSEANARAGSRRPRLTMTDIRRALEYIVDKQKKKVRVIYLDYLQRINRADCKGDTREAYMEIMDRVKDIALDFNTCAVIGSQVRREVRERKWRQPQDNDAQETSNFEHTCDGIISLQLPYKWEKLGETVIEGIPPVRVTEKLMLINTLKQKRGKAPVLSAVDFDPTVNEIRAYTPPTYFDPNKDDR